MKTFIVLFRGINVGGKNPVSMKALAEVLGERDYKQFGSPDWFWQKYPNSYALQVEPKRFISRDEAVLEHAEAVHIQMVRDEVFND